jgi:hypothetical protein
MLSFLRRNLDKLVFAVGLALVVFAYGVAVGKFRLFPHDMIEAATEAARDWSENWRHYLGIRSKWVQDTARAGSVTKHDSTRAWAGHTFVTAFRDNVFGGVLLDMDGKILHEWKLPIAEIWARAGYEGDPMPEVDVAIHGAHMEPNGDLILAVAGRALVRLDPCSKVIWSTRSLAHHALDVLPNGEILTPGAVTHTAPNPRWPRMRPGPAGYFDDQTIIRAAPDGKVLEEFSITDVLYESDWAALLLAGRGSSFVMAEADPYHLNDVEMLRPEMAAAFPMFKAGDLLVDLRNLQTMVVLDGETRKVKWSMTGPFFGQHDPNFAPNGRIIVFDNRITGNSPQLGYSRVLEIDPATRRVVWSYEGSDREPFYTPIGGKVQWLPNGNILAGEPQGGRVFEIARANGQNEIVWEWVNQIEPGRIGMIFDIQRVPAVTEPWVGKACT